MNDKTVFGSTTKYGRLDGYAFNRATMRPIPAAESECFVTIRQHGGLDGRKEIECPYKNLDLPAAPVI
jgi:hypothetical protein